MGREEHLRRWSAAHGGTPASPVVRVWLDGVRRVASPLAAAGVPPSAVTVLGLVLGLAALAPAAAQAEAGGRWALLVALLLALAALADGLDGAVAVLGGTASRGGAVLDAACDRVADAAAVAALWLLGAPALPVLVAVGAGQLHEYARARAQAEGMTGPGAVTVSERPTRVAVAAMFALGCGAYPQAAATWAAVGAWVGAAAALAGLLQVLAAVRRALSGRR
ncbi:CDP-alcohol phosphatidyltransferase family protein [Streptomyces sp. NP160]|nr:CDP-alcohol phosphatidyltransferase family protein [Streptomyces sp. NP160]